MFSKVLASQVQAPDRDEPLEAAKIPLKNKGMDIASQMRLVKKAEPNHASALGHYSPSVEQTLSVIEAIENKLQHKRRQIEEIQTRYEALALESREIGRTLESATKDLAQQFAGIISDLETDIPIEASDLGLETSDLPPLPKFLGDRQKPLEQT
jgi:chromosome segregation ATPase